VTPVSAKEVLSGLQTVCWAAMASLAIEYACGAVMALLPSKEQHIVSTLTRLPQGSCQEHSAFHAFKGKFTATSGMQVLLSRTG